MSSSLPIGFFDSGVGGLSVFARFRTKLPHENTIYYGDLKNLPYGNKTQTELIGFARKILDFFSEQKVKAVVIACNTSSALAYESVKNDYEFKIYPIIQSCAKVIANKGLNRIGVFATSGTVLSKAYSKEICKYNSNILVHEIACPSWVSLVEGRSKNFADIKLYLDEMLKFNPDKIILGCTHYPYLMNHLTKFVPKELFLDPSEIFVDYIKEDLKKFNLLNSSSDDGTETFYVSADQEAFLKNSFLFYRIESLPRLVY